MTPKLLAISGPVNGKSFLLTQYDNSIGREPSNQICIPDGLISRQHCRIVISGESESRQFRLVDVGSINGTRVNNDLITEHWLVHGEVIRIGNTTLLFLCNEEVSSPSGEQAVEFEDTPLGQRPTLAIERQDALHLNDGPLSSDSPTQEPASQLIREFQQILRLMLEISSLRELELLHRRLFELIGELVPAERGAILLAPTTGNEPVTAYVWTRTPAVVRPFTLSRTIIRRVFAEGKAFLNNDPMASAELRDAKSLIGSGIHSVLALPLAVARHVYGVLYLDARNPARRFDKDHLHLMTTIAEAVGPAYDSARQMADLRDESRRLRDELKLDREMIGQSPPMVEVRDFIAHVAPTNFTVLIQGESGTGKELVARAIHQNSTRRDKPFLAINCAVGPETLFESELFGHEKGAFTGATAMKKGKLEQANGGTVFLDEIGELAPNLQAKLLRVLQEREIERVGGSRAVPLDIRVIAATNKDLEATIKAGSFREDLFYRLSAVEVMIPALRDRRDDILLIANHLLAKHAAQSGRRIHAISPEAGRLLTAYSWPGNVRELENALSHAVVFCNSDTIEADDLPDHVVESQPPEAVETDASPAARSESQAPYSTPSPVMKYHDAVRHAKRQIIANAIEQAGGDYHLAARMLGIHVNNLHRHVRELGLRPPKTKSSP
jgi:Nif-specific regulatory protein